MKTIIRIHQDADFSANNIGAVDFEPAITMPAVETGLVGYRTKRSVAESTDLFGNPAFIDEAPESVFDRVSANVNLSNTGWLRMNGKFTPAGPSTLAVVFYQQAEAPSSNSGIFGSMSSSAAADRCAFMQSSSGLYAAYRNAEQVTLSPDGGARWEMLVATFDPDGNEMKIIRPRTASETVGSCAGATAGAREIRAYGDNGVYSSGRGCRGALFAVWEKALDAGEIGDFYVSAKTALAFSGIEI